MHDKQISFKNASEYESEKQFSCMRCGACCRNLQAFAGMYAELNDGTGVCKYFIPETSSCCLYPIRPLKCRIEEGYFLFASHIDYEEFIALTKKGCTYLRTLESKN